MRLYNFESNCSLFLAGELNSRLYSLIKGEIKVRYKKSNYEKIISRSNY